jgi:STE24 endopeptidase
MRPIKPVRRVSAVISFALTLAFVFTSLGPRIETAVHSSWWPLNLVAILAVTTLISTMVSLPFGYWRSMVHDKRWGFTTHGLKTWILDQLKGLALGLVIGGLLLTGLWALVRWTLLWWLIAGLAVGLVVIIFSFIFPVLLLPLFYKQKEITEGEVKARIDRVTALTGVDIKRAFVMNASSRDTRDNAFVGGVARTKRVVVFDTLLGHPGHVVDNVVAHEVGHYRLRHILLQVPAAMALSLVSYFIIAVITSFPQVLHLGGVSSLGDPAALPIFSLVSEIVGLPIGLMQPWLTRVLERQADLEALEVLSDPGANVDTWRRMTTKNLGELEPSRWQRLKHDHPENAERMAFAKAWAELNQVQIVEPPADAPPLVAAEVAL